MMTKQLTDNRLLRLLLFALVLGVVFASRVQFLTDTPLNRDEARSGMRMMGTPAEIVSWQPPDWPPLHNVLLGSWSSIAGEFPFSLRVFSAFFSIISVVFAYRMAYYLTKDRRVAWGTLIFYAGLGMSVHLGIFIRGYVMTIALFPLAIWFTARYFQEHRLWDALGLAIMLGLMFLTTYSAVPAFFFLGLFTLLLYPRQIWRWIPVGILASPFAAYELFRKWDYWIKRAVEGDGSDAYINYFDDVYIEHFQHFFGQIEPAWILLAVVAITLFIWHGQQQPRLFVWAVVGCLLAPVITFWMVESGVFVLMRPRYSWWALLMLALAFSMGLRYLPRPVWTGVMVVILGLMFTLPLNSVYYTEDEFAYEYEDNMEWLSGQAQSGDVLLFDPNYCIRDCFDQDAIAYFWDVYLDETVERVEEPGDRRRVWLWRGIGHSRELVANLHEGRVPSIFYGPPISLLELYVAPPDPEGIPFENGMRFHGFDILHEDGRIDVPPYDLRELSTMRIRLWWSADRPIDGDYQVSLQIHDPRKNQLYTQDDSAPQLVYLKPNAFEPLPQRTSEWTPSQLYVEERTIELPNSNIEIYADLYLVVYQLSDGVRVSAPGTTENGLLPLDSTTIWAWG